MSAKEVLKKIVLPDDYKPGLLVVSLTFDPGKDGRTKRLLFTRVVEKKDAVDRLGYPVEEGICYSYLNDEEVEAFEQEVPGILITDAPKRVENKVEKVDEARVSVDAPPAAIIDGAPATDVLEEPVRGKKK